MGSFRYDSSHRGWTALGIGPWMTGALMFITYGDPKAEGVPMTLSVRTADGHSPPRPLSEKTELFQGSPPVVDIITSKFIPYTGEFYSGRLNKAPSHLGVAEFIVRGYDKWNGVKVSNTSVGQEFIWSSNFKQGWEGDYSVDRAIDMHQFGLGFGFLWVDLLNAVVPKPGFGPIDDREGHKGLSEISPPVPPTEEELAYGESIASSLSDIENGVNDPIPPSEPQSDDSPPSEAETIPDTPSSDTPAPDSGTVVEQPVGSAKQWNIRSLMWHLHGLLMVLSFMVLYPLGVYMLRSPRPTAFNLHWTINALASVSVAISSMIGYVNSRSISLTHQYLGIAIVVALVCQLLLGWRHHVAFLATKRTSWMAEVHVWLGRCVLPLGLMNIVFGLLLRQYGWFTIGVTVAVMALEVVALALVLGKARGRTPVLHHGGPGGDKGLPTTGADAEEYFQLAGDDDDDEFSSDDESGQARQTREEEKKAQSQRLAKLDKV